MLFVVEQYSWNNISDTPDSICLCVCVCVCVFIYICCQIPGYDSECWVKESSLKLMLTRFEQNMMHWSVNMAVLLITYLILTSYLYPNGKWLLFGVKLAVKISYLQNFAVQPCSRLHYSVSMFILASPCVLKYSFSTALRLFYL